MKKLFKIAGAACLAAGGAYLYVKGIVNLFNAINEEPVRECAPIVITISKKVTDAVEEAASTES